MKILVLTSRFPYPLEKGDKLRIYYQMRELAARGHQIVLVALTEHAVESVDFQQVSVFCSTVSIFRLSKVSIFFQILSQILLSATKSRMLSGRGAKLPFQVAYFFNKNIKTKIEQLIEAEKPDHIYCHLARMAPYIADQNLPKTLDFMDAFGAGSERRGAVASFFTRPFWRIETQRMLDYEAFLFQKFDKTTIIAAQDRAWLPLSNLEKNQVAVVPNGVDTQFFSAKLSEGLTQSHALSTKTYDLCFVGNLGYYSNVEAVRFLVKNILPILKKQKPDIKILLAGARPMAEVQNFADENVIVKGWFDDIREAYACSKIMVAPLMHGTGQQNKILEAMAMGIPVVTTSRVNNAIGATAESEILLADTEGVFSEQILKLLQSIDLQQLIAENARQFVLKNYSWQASVAILEDIFMSEKKHCKGKTLIG